MGFMGVGFTRNSRGLAQTPSLYCSGVEPMKAKDVKTNRAQCVAAPRRSLAPLAYGSAAVVIPILILVVAALYLVVEWQ
jgi:hypothetical protein